MKSGTNSEEKVGNGSDFASMLTKYQKKAAQNDETKKAETGETKNKETQPEETKNRGNEKQVNGRQSGENVKTDEIKAENINKIIDTYKNRVDVDKYAHVATYDEIVENDYNLNIPRYVDTFEEEEVIPLPDVMKELNDVRQEIEKTSKELFELLDQLEGTTPEAKAELDNFMKLLK